MRIRGVEISKGNELVKGRMVGKWEGLSWGVIREREEMG